MTIAQTAIQRASPDAVGGGFSLGAGSGKTTPGVGVFIASQINPATGKHFGGSLASMPVIGDLGYIALTAFVLNVLVAVVLTLVLRAAKVSNGSDQTTSYDYFADVTDPTVAQDLAVHGGARTGTIEA